MACWTLWRDDSQEEHFCLLYQLSVWFYECVLLELDESLLLKHSGGSSSEINCCERGCEHVYSIVLEHSRGLNQGKVKNHFLHQNGEECSSAGMSQMYVLLLGFIDTGWRSRWAEAAVWVCGSCTIRELNKNPLFCNSSEFSCKTEDERRRLEMGTSAVQSGNQSAIWWPWSPLCLCPGRFRMPILSLHVWSIIGV